MESQSTLANIQLYLNKYRNTQPLTTNMEFLRNKNVFSSESQLPDLYLKTRVPFDKNQCFVQTPSKKTVPNLYPRYIYFYIVSHWCSSCLLNLIQI